MKKYEQIDISGDVGIRIRGNTMEELFENAAAGMSDLITDISGIRDTGEKEITINADSRENLLVQWLNELVFLFDTYGYMGRSFSVKLKQNRLDATISGGIFDPEFNERRLLIKAATYHGLSVRRAGDGWEATVIFDI